MKLLEITNLICFVVGGLLDALALSPCDHFGLLRLFCGCFLILEIDGRRGVLQFWMDARVGRRPW